jgi:hypothetical protein
MSPGACHLSLAWTTCIQSTAYHPTSESPILIIIMHTYKPRSSMWSLSLRFGQWDPVHISHILHICHKPCPDHPPWFHNTHTHTHTAFYKQWKSKSSTVRTFLHPPVTSSLSDLNIFYSILSTNIPSLYFSLTVRDFKFQKPHKTEGTITVQQNLTFRFLYTKQENKRFWPEWYQAFCELIFC